MELSNTSYTSEFGACEISSTTAKLQFKPSNLEASAETTLITESVLSNRILSLYLLKYLSILCPKDFKYDDAILKRMEACDAEFAATITCELASSRRAFIAIIETAELLPHFLLTDKMKVLVTLVSSFFHLNP